MNGNDLLDALSGIDHKYIDEAAYELHEIPVQQKKAKVIRLNRTALIAIPAAAVILLTVSVALPSLMRMKNESASYGASDSAAPAYDAAEAPSYDAAEAPSYDAEMAAETAPAYESEYEAADMAAEYDAEAPADAEAIGAAEVSNDRKEATAASSPAAILGLESAEYSAGILTLEISEILPDDIADMDYVITETAGGTVCSSGRLGEILRDTDPLTLDLSKADLPAGTYSLNIAGESIEFTVQ